MNIETLVPILGANLLWQTLLLALVVGLALRVLPKYAARTRYRIALLALFGSGLLCAAPFLPDLTPEISVGLTPQTITAAPVPEITATTPITSPNPATVIAAELPRISIGKIILTVWAIGTFISLLRLSRAALTAIKWTRAARPISLPDHNILSKPIRIRRSRHVSTPLVLGLFKPVVLVPDDFDLRLDNPGTRAVLEHEIAHLTRKDLWTNFAQHLVLAALWWCLPLYWINTQIGIEREKLCDDVAAQKTGTGRDLATALVDLADKHSTEQPLLAIGIHPRAHHLAERIHRLCKETPMPKLSKRLLMTTTIAVPALIGSLILAAPRAIAHSPSHTFNIDRHHGADISSLQYALFNAASRGRVEEVRNILGMGVDPAFHLHGDGSPLILAAKTGNTEIAGLLLTHGAKINRMTASDESALINAVKTNHLDMVKFLVERGADVSLGQVSNPIRRPEWRSPLSTAEKHGRTQIAQYLQSQGAVADSRKQKLQSFVAGPIVDGRLTSIFGATRKRFGGKSHTGIDIANAPGTPIFAPADGTIIEVTDTYKGKTSWGHVVVLQTSGGVETAFGHLQDSQVSVGDRVTQGMQIARVGNTGKSTGPHVHIQTTRNGELVDPMTVWTSLAR